MAKKKMPTKKKILLVEDEMALVEVIEEKLESRGFEVIVAKNGKEGLDQAKRKKPDLILLDIVMPKMDGMEMLQKLRKDLKSKVPVIILTNLGSDEDAKDALAQGADEFLIKANLKLDDVVKKVKEVLGV